MKYGSVCSGIEGATVAWHPLGWRAAWYAEVDPFCSALLKYHYPETPNYGDFTRVDRISGEPVESGSPFGSAYANGELSNGHSVRWGSKDRIKSEPIDLLVGGTPCQSFSVAGKRAGLDDARGNLTLEYLALAGRLRPRWLVWENVPGVLSIDGGRTFGTFLGLLGQLGYGFAYRVLDAQHFGVPQRRRRVFVVGHLGDWRRAAAVLFERSCLSGHPAPSRETGQDIARCVATGTNSQRYDWETENFVTFQNTGQGWWNESPTAAALRTPKGSGSLEANVVANPLPSHHPRADLDNDTYVTVGALQSGGTPNGHGTAGVNRQAVNAGHVIAFDYKQSGETDPTMQALGHDKSHANGGGHLAVAFRTNQTNAQGPIWSEEITDSLAQDHPPAVIRSGVRRLTPRECERLQGFPDDYTAIPYRGKAAADGPRYRALGNSFAVPVVRWIGERIQMVEDLERRAEENA